eukprot:765270-Hanusia_phi.AAC.2
MYPATVALAASRAPRSESGFCGGPGGRQPGAGNSGTIGEVLDDSNCLPYSLTHDSLMILEFLAGSCRHSSLPGSGGLTVPG